MMVLPLLGLDAPPRLAQPTKTPLPIASYPYDLIDMVNQLRAARGLRPYQINAALMASAQAHSEYQASIHKVSRAGQDNSTAQSRAEAAGYGGGWKVLITENIYGGTMAMSTPQQAVLWWQGDQQNLDTMLSSAYVDVGAGAATDGEWIYFTLDVGYTVGTDASGTNVPLASPGAGVPVVESNPGEQTATPMPDGSIVHEVKTNESLWFIATLYRVTMAQIVELNHLSANSVLSPGQKLLIKTPGTPTRPPPTPTITPGGPTATRRPTKTPTVVPTEMALTQASPTVLAVESPAEKAANTSKLSNGLLLIGIGLLVVGGAAFAVVGSFLQRSR